MINITLIAVGKLKEKYLRDAVDEYSKRLGAFCKINIIEIDEEKIGDNPSSAQIQNVIEKEGQRIIKKIPKKHLHFRLRYDMITRYKSNRADAPSQASAF